MKNKPEINKINKIWIKFFKTNCKNFDNGDLALRKNRSQETFKIALPFFLDLKL